jgi:hypothetical protein
MIVRPWRRTTVDPSFCFNDFSEFLTFIGPSSLPKEKRPGASDYSVEHSGTLQRGIRNGDAVAVAKDRRLSRLVAHEPIYEQSACLEVALKQNHVAQALLAVARDLAVPDWYFGAGGAAQTVWNLLHGFEPSAGIKDYDLAYFDATDLAMETEKQIEAEVAHRLAGLGIVIDVKNEARVHLWYLQRFGRQLKPYLSTGEAIATWPTTASSIGVRYDEGRFVVCAPFGLSDVFAMVARPNKVIVSRDVYEEKVARWANRWPELTVIPW